MNRIYIFGPSGSGTTTLASQYAKTTQAFHLDTDEFYWADTDPPYKSAIPPQTRISAIDQRLEPHSDWVISGCMCSWGMSILDQTTSAVFLWLPWSIRRVRLRERELKRFGSNCLDHDGHRHDHYKEFEAWAEAYDSADQSMRSRQRHESWIADYEATQRTVLRMETDEPVETRLNKLLSAIKANPKMA